MTTPKNFLDWARRQVGTRENPPGSNRTEYHRIAGRPQGWAWCGIFLEAGARTTGLELPGPLYYTPNGYAAFRRIGRVGRTPRPGAFAFVYYPSLGRIGHVGVVESVRGSTVTCIEGNTNPGQSRTGIGVFRNRRPALVPWDGRHRGIVAYAYPNYDGSSQPPEDAMPSAEEIRDTLLSYTPDDYSGSPGTTFGSAQFKAALAYERLPGWLAELEGRLNARLDVIEKKLDRLAAERTERTSTADLAGSPR